MRADLRAVTVEPGIIGHSIAMNILCALILLSSTAVAGDGGTIVGKVTADGSTAVADATVVLEDGPNGIVRAVATSGDGSYFIEDVPLGHYRFWVAADGYAVVHREVVIEGEEALELNIELHPDGNTQLWHVAPADREAFREATLLLAEYRVLEAMEKFEGFLVRYPYLVRAHYNVGLCHVELAAKERDFNLGEAADHHERSARGHFCVVLERYPDYSPALVALAESYVRTLEMTQAEAAYERLLKLNPGEAEQWYTYAEVLAYLRKLPESEAAFERVLEIDPLYFDAHARIGAIRMAEEDYEEAIRRFEIFLAAAPKSNMAPLTRELLDEARSMFEAGKQPQLEQ